MSRRLHVIGYNLDNNRDRERVHAEVASLLRLRPDALAWCEGQGYTRELAIQVGYDLLTTRGKGPSARDAGLLARHGHKVTGYRLARTGVRWRRDKDPSRWHWPRSFPTARIGGVRFVSVHMPRQNHAAAYAACYVRLLLIAARWPRQPLVFVGDWNKGAHRTGLWSPRQFARLIGGQIVGRGIDFAVVRGCTGRDYHHLDGFYASDHEPFALTIEVNR